MQELELANGGTQPRAASLVVSDYVESNHITILCKKSDCQGKCSYKKPS